MGRTRHFRRRMAMAGQAVRAAIVVRTSGGQRTPMNREQVASRLPALPRFVPVVIEKWYKSHSKTFAEGAKRSTRPGTVPGACAPPKWIYEIGAKNAFQKKAAPKGGLKIQIKYFYLFATAYGQETKSTQANQRQRSRFRSRHEFDTIKG